MHALFMVEVCMGFLACRVAYWQQQQEKGKCEMAQQEGKDKRAQNQFSFSLKTPISPLQLPQNNSAF
jgi:hypothetical protein